MKRIVLFLLLMIILNQLFSQELAVQRFPLKLILLDINNQRTTHIYKIDDSLFLPSGIFELLGVGKLVQENEYYVLETKLEESVIIDDHYREIRYKGITTHFSKSLVDYTDELLFPLDLLYIVIKNIYNYSCYFSIENLTLFIGRMDDSILRILLSFSESKANIDIYYKENGQFIINKKKNQIELVLLGGTTGAFSWKKEPYPFLSIHSDNRDSHKAYISLNDEDFSFSESRDAKNKFMRISVESPRITISLDDNPNISDQQKPLQNIIIDPGHGGDDTGAVGFFNIKEKDIVLDIALILKSLIERYLGMNVILTREEDVFVSLEQRTDIANNNNGDLFISLHANWSKFRQARGFEVFYANTYATDDDSLLISQIENLSLTDEDFQKKSLADLELILWDLAQSEFLEESMEFSSIINDFAVSELNIVNRGVKQAPFFVLLGANMPASLVEIGFITNKSEANVMQTREYQQKIANVIFMAVREYSNRFNRRRGIADSHFYEIIPQH